eukprot:9491022-Pyramimonas_sp.AAC.1
MSPRVSVVLGQVLSLKIADLALQTCWWGNWVAPFAAVTVTYSMSVGGPRGVVNRRAPVCEGTFAPRAL